MLHGDSRCAAIAAASIVAKVTRDRHMLELHARDPRYGFDRHKGYATADHLSAVARYGYSAVHRRSFRPPSLFDATHPEAADLPAGHPADQEGQGSGTKIAPDEAARRIVLNDSGID